MHGQQLCRRLEVQPGSLLRFAAHQVVLVVLRAQQAGTVGGGVAVVSVPAAGRSPEEASSFGPAVDQGHKSLAEMREERQVHPNMECAVEYRGSKVPHLFHGHSYHRRTSQESALHPHATLLSTLPVASRFWRTSLRASTSVLVTVLISPSSVRATAVDLADIPRCVACVLFGVHLFETFDYVYFQRSCNVTNLEHVNLLQEQVAATLLDPRNMPWPDLKCIPPDQHDQGWALLRGMVICRH